MWIRVEYRQQEAYVDLERVVRINFMLSKDGTQIESASLYAVGGGEGLVALGTVRGDALLRKLREHIGLIRSDEVVL
jgi:hypothetical protein